MKFPEKGRFEYNFNTFLLLGGIVAGLATTGGTWGYFISSLASADRETKEWQARHEDQHRERARQISESQAKADQRLTQLELDSRKIGNLEYRITVAEQAGLTTAKAIEQLGRTVNEQSSDIRVMREIIERQFGSSFQRPQQRR